MKKKSMKIINRNQLMLNFTYLKFRILFLICHFSRLFNDEILFKMIMIVYAAYEKSNDISN